MTADRPNVLLIVTDQERSDCAAPGRPAVATPGSDRIAAEGVRFERAYTPTAICSPARASLLTGLYPHAHGVLSNPTRESVRTDLPADLPTFGGLLADAGYRTTYAGKWHVGTDQTPADFGFERVAAGTHAPVLDTDDYRAYARDRGVDPDDVTVDRVADVGDVTAGTVDLPPEATQTYYLAERTIDALERHAAADSPFLHRLDFPGPHAPYVVPEPYASRYDPGDLDPWPSFAETFDGKPAIHEIHPEYYGVDGLAWETWAEAVAKYFGFVTFVEEQVARVLDAVDDLGLADDTVVVRTADHGDFAGGHRQYDKGPMMYEDLYRIPLRVRWPGVADAGRSVDEFVGLHDLMPTVCEAGGVTPPETHGRSLVGLLRGETPAWRDAFVAEYHGEPETLYTQRMLRTDRYKFVYNGPDVNELYDLDADPHELRNLIDHPEYEGVRRDLATRLGDWMERTGDHVAVDRYRRRCL